MVIGNIYSNTLLIIGYILMCSSRLVFVVRKEKYNIALLIGVIGFACLMASVIFIGGISKISMILFFTEIAGAAFACGMLIRNIFSGRYVTELWKKGSYRFSVNWRRIRRNELVNYTDVWFAEHNGEKYNLFGAPPFAASETPEVRVFVNPETKVCVIDSGYDWRDKAEIILLSICIGAPFITLLAFRNGLRTDDILHPVDISFPILTAVVEMGFYSVFRHGIQNNSHAVLWKICGWFFLVVGGIAALGSFLTAFPYLIGSQLI